MKILTDQSLKPLSTFQIGGKACFVINWTQSEDLPKIIDFAKKEQLPILPLGGGSNILFPDQDLEGIVVRCMTKTIQIETDGTIMTDAGVRWTALAQFMKKNKLYGIEALLSIPGSIGGAIWGNAGCHNQEAKDVLAKVEYYDISTNKYTIATSKEVRFSYRHSEFAEQRNKIITRAWFNVSNNEAESHGSLQEFLQFRKEKQPQGLTTGSFFKNPYPDFAGALIEKAGLKGFSIGDVAISDKHANFVINKGNGTAEQIIELIQTVQNIVFEKFKTRLEPEVKVLSIKDFISVC